MARPILLAVDGDASACRVMRAAGAQAALDTLAQLKSRDEPVALLVSGQRLPGMSGVEMLERTHTLS